MNTTTKLCQIPLIAVGTILISATVAEAASLTLDSFDESTITNIGAGNLAVAGSTIFPTGTTVNQTNGPASTILGGTRDLTLEFLSGPQSNPFPVTIQTAGCLNSGENCLSFSSGVGVLASFSLAYDGLSAFDITDGGVNTNIAIGIDFSDLGGSVEIIATSGINSDSFITTFPIGQSDSIGIEFSEFSGVDFTALDSIVFNFEPVTSAQLSLTFLEFAPPATAIPEPKTMLGTAAALGMGVYLKRRKQA
ncbi:PEP-CTERM sorting domain-containing protein [Synechococcus sp. PCC 7336]|uniref:PEP-CTERM sorting domain-containing protein n=1 Tax=Synechococcus sp. PCC 7336 TaxID=195250 RepID=UPI000368B103|nr:PEP-CTERM sorting domain-containing protein [Synechococcus sp. PCC 7336]